MVKWRGVLAVEDVLTGDGRMMDAGSLRWGELPVPLRWAREDSGEHNGAVVVGRIETIERDGNNIIATGVFDEGSQDGLEAARQVRDGITNGISVDLDDVSIEVRVAADLMEDDDGEMPEPDENGMITVVAQDANAEILIVKDARIRAATLVAIPAFAEARIDLAEDVEVPDEPVDEPEPETMTASGAPVEPPAEWFTDPKLTQPTPLTVTDDGRVFGHMGGWDSCHTGFSGECVTPPRSQTGYAFFHTGSVQCADGSVIATGRLTFDTIHAPQHMKAADAVAHYEHTGLVGADVVVGEDAHGLWFSGALRPDLTPEQVRAFRASPPSGDWRRIGTSLELVGVLHVNTPGFPVTRALVASGVVQTVQTRSHTLKPGDTLTLSAEDHAMLQRMLQRERERTATLTASVHNARQRVMRNHARIKVKA